MRQTAGYGEEQLCGWGSKFSWENWIWTWWHEPVIPALGMLKLEDGKFRASWTIWWWDQTHMGSSFYSELFSLLWRALALPTHIRGLISFACPKPRDWLRWAFKRNTVMSRWRTGFARRVITAVTASLSISFNVCFFLCFGLFIKLPYTMGF